MLLCRRQLAARRVALIRLSLTEARARGVRLIVSTARASELVTWAAKEAGLGLLPLVDEDEAQVCMEHGVQLLRCVCTVALLGLLDFAGIFGEACRPVFWQA